VTTRNWTGGNGRITSAKNWAPGGSPQPGDVLTIYSGSMDISGHQLPATESLSTGGTATVNLNQTSSANISVSGHSTVNMRNSTGALSVFNNFTPGIDNSNNITVSATGNNNLDLTTHLRAVFGNVTVHNSGVLTGSLNGFSTNYTIDGGQFHNIDSTAGQDLQTITVNADVVGAGKWNVNTFHGPSGKLEFMKSVGSEQTVTMASGLSGHPTLQIDHPETFKAAITWQTDSALVDLVGLAADSYNQRDGALDFFHGNTLVDTLRINVPTTEPITVSQGTSTGGLGVEISSTPVPGGRPFAADIPHGAALPVHAFG